MLTDSFQRKHDYLRVSITDKCNLRCNYCMPPEGIKFLSHDQVLRNEEFLHLIKIFVEMGIKKVRFTGGEPLVRKGFLDILNKTRENFPDLELALTTNGVLLKKYTQDLQRLNLKKINISLDSLSPENYQKITGFNYLPQVIDNFESLLATNFFDLKINAVLFKGTLEEIDNFLEYFKDKKVLLRFIERMPFPGNELSPDFIPADHLIHLLVQKGRLSRNEPNDTQVAKMYTFFYRDKYKINLGIIPPLTHNFCAQCNRLRLTADGSLKVCLHCSDEYNLKNKLRNQTDDVILKQIISKAINLKKKGHQLDCYAGNEGCFSISNSSSQRPMSKIGG